jgi:hypothetical protein
MTDVYRKLPERTYSIKYHATKRLLLLIHSSYYIPEVRRQYEHILLASANFPERQKCNNMFATNGPSLNAYEKGCPSIQSRWSFVAKTKCMSGPYARALMNTRRAQTHFLRDGSTIHLQIELPNVVALIHMHDCSEQ